MKLHPARRWCAAVAIAVVLTASAGPAHAKNEPTTMKDAMLGIASGLCTLVYTPVKLVYATTGTAVGGLVWLFSAGHSDSMHSVLKTTAGGDYVVTPEHLRGLRVLQWTGRP